MRDTNDRPSAGPPPTGRRHGPLVTFTDEFGDTTTGVFLGIGDGPNQPALILDGGRITRRATRTRAGDRIFTLRAA